MRIKEHGALVDVLPGGGVIVQPATGKNVTLDGKVNTGLDAGSNDTYVITLDPVPSAYFAGQVFWFKANTANTGAATLNVNGLGAKAIKKVVGGITTALADNDIRAGQYVHLIYDGTNFQMLSASGNATADFSALLATSITDGDTTHAPDGNTVFDALALKLDASAIPVKATGAELDTGTDDAKFATAKALADSGYAVTSDIPVKAIGSEVNTGTDDAKFLTAKAVADSYLGDLVSAPAAFIADPTGATTDTDVEARAAIDSILDLLIAKGLMAAS